MINEFGFIKSRVVIDQHPAIVDEKVRFGDLEIDAIVGKNHKGALLTINDRAYLACMMDQVASWKRR